MPNTDGKDPEFVNPRYRIRGNGEWRFRPNLKDAKAFARVVHNVQGPVIRKGKDGGLTLPEDVNFGTVVFKLNSANVITGLEMTVDLSESAGGGIRFAVSRDNGLHWVHVQEEPSPPWATKVFADKQVNGAYEVLVRLELSRGIVINDLRFLTTTALNSKTLPRLNLGRNTVYVGAGDQTDSIVLWPELQNGKYKEMIVEEKNVTSTRQHPGHLGTLHPFKANEDAYIVYRLDAPRDLTRLTYGGRFYNRAPKSHIDLYHSFDGQTWHQSWSLTDTAQPWDVIHYETVNVPKGHRSVYVRYLMHTPDPNPSGCSIYAVRMEANHLPASTEFRPVQVTFEWFEVLAYGLEVKRSHTQVLDKLPAKYVINVGGKDHPIMHSLAVNLTDLTSDDPTLGYSDNKDVGGERFVGKWVTYGNNLAVGKPYTTSLPSETSWEAGDPDGKKLTDGIVGPPYSGGVSYRSGAIWSPRKNPVITLDLGSVQSCASFGLNMHGYPAQDALKGEIQDQIEVLISEDGKTFTSIGFLKTDLRWKDLPANHMWTDEETLTAHTFRHIPENPLPARYIQYRITNPRHLCVTELEVLDSINHAPFDLRIALPDEK